MSFPSSSVDGVSHTQLQTIRSDAHFDPPEERGTRFRAGNSPIGIDVVEGKSYYWCTCGKSSKQPFCDGSHDGSKFGPMTYKAEQTKKVFFCTCKQTKDQPLCDGSHNLK